MMFRRYIVLAGLLGPAAAARAQQGQGVEVTDSQPKAHAVIGGRSSAFYVRFNRPVDHADSRLSITRDGRVVEILEPRLESAPEVLFARAPTLPAGSYILHWRVGGPAPLEGEIPFTVSGG